MANISAIREKMEEDLNGLCICDYLTREDCEEYLENFDSWAETAKPGDTYRACDFSYTYIPEYEILVWPDKDRKEEGEPVYMTPNCDISDLEAIKKECETYNLQSTRCIEISLLDEDEPVLRYEDGKWVNC